MTPRSRLTLRRLWPTASIGVVIAAPFLMAGCGPSSTVPADGGVSEREASALNDAAEMLDNDSQDAVVETNAAAGAGNVE